MTCPYCGSTLEHVPDGVVEETVIDGKDGHREKRKARPAAFYACMRCEYCCEAVFARSHD